MLMSFWDSKEPQCHGLRLFGNLGVYQGIVSSLVLLCLGGWEQETECTLLILMLAVSSVQIMKKAIVTSSLLEVGHPSCGQRWNPGFSPAGVWPPLVVLFGALISGGKTLLPGWKGLPQHCCLLDMGRKESKSFWKLLHTGWICFSKISGFILHDIALSWAQSSLNFCELTVLVDVLNVLYCGMLSSLRFAVHIVTTSELIVLVVIASLEVFLCCMILMSITPCNFWCPRCFFFVFPVSVGAQGAFLPTCLSFCFVLDWEPCNLWFLT